MPAGGAVRGAAAGLTFATGRTVTAVAEVDAGSTGSVDVVTSDSPDDAGQGEDRS